VAYNYIFTQDRVLSNINYGSSPYSVDFRTFRSGKINTPVNTVYPGNGINSGAVKAGYMKLLQRKAKAPVEKENPLCGGKIVSGDKQKAFYPALSGYG
jgi:hypothetical protein